MSADQPAVSLGLPVYNGENFLHDALDSVLGQSFQDWELVVSDNHSDDGSEAICRALAERDPRVRFFRQEENLGAGPNYNFVFHRTRGRYFKWISHDDRMDPNYLEVCFERLEREPDAVLCHGVLIDTDENGEVLRTFEREGTLDHDVVERLRTVIRFDHNCQEIFGLIRRDALARTGLIRDYTDSDRTLLAELVLAGRFVQDDRARHLRRVHDQKSTLKYADRMERARWFNPRNEGRIVLPAQSQVLDVWKAVFTSPLPLATKRACLPVLLRNILWNRGVYRDEYAWLIRRVLGRT